MEINIHTDRQTDRHRDRQRDSQADSLGERQGLSPRDLFVGWLLNVPATCECISGTDLLRQFYVLPH